MGGDKLAAMANQVGQFFRAYPDDQARAGIKEHLQAFWTPKMLDALLTKGPHDGLDPLVRSALWREPEADSPVRQEVFDPEVGGPIMSDAG